MYISSSSSSELSLSDYEESVPGQEMIFEHKSNNHHEAVAVNQVCADEEIEVEDFDIEESEEGLHL